MKYLLQRLAGTHLDSDGSQLFKFERELPHKSNTPFILAVELQSGYGLYDFRTYIYNILFTLGLFKLDIVALLVTNPALLVIMVWISVVMQLSLYM